MEDLESADSPTVMDDTRLPEGNADPQDPLRPEIEEENSTRTPPFADPGMDMEATEDTAADVPDRDDYDDDDNNNNDDDNDDNNDDNDKDSDALSDVDEAQFEDFDANAIAIEERPRVVDASGVALLGKHKRKRDGDEGGEGGKKKRKEGRREKPKRSKKRADEGDDYTADGDDAEGGRGSRRKKRGTAEGDAPRRRQRTPSEERDQLLTPEEREYCCQLSVLLLMYKR